MIYKIDIMHPFIQTIPDESTPFLILEQGSKSFDKFVMENYINFYAYCLDDHNRFALRFENHTNWDGFDGFSSLHIPLDLQVKLRNKLDLLIDSLNEGYILMCDYNTCYIEFTKNSGLMNHRLIIYGYDTTCRKFFCMEFLKRRLTKFEVGFDELITALTDFPWKTYDTGGILGLKYNKNYEGSEISLYKLSASINALLESKIIQKTRTIEAFGIKALQICLDSYLYYPMLDNQIKYCYEWLNYIRESGKLMQHRLSYIENMSSKSVSKTTKINFKNFKDAVDEKFLGILKVIIKRQGSNIIIKEVIQDCYVILNKYESFLKEFKVDLQNIQNDMTSKFSINFDKLKIAKTE